MPLNNDCHEEDDTLANPKHSPQKNAANTKMWREQIRVREREEKKRKLLGVTTFRVLYKDWGIVSTKIYLNIKNI